MFISELIEILKKFPEDSEVSLRDLNGLDWEIGEKEILSEGKFIIFNTKNINLIPRP